MPPTGSARPFPESRPSGRIQAGCCPLLVVFGLGTTAMCAAPATGQSQFEPWQTFPFSSMSGAVAADLSGNGLNDIALFSPLTLNQNPRLHVIFNAGGGQFEVVDTGIESERWPRSLLAADIDGNGTIDLIWTTYGSAPGSGLKVFYNDGDGRTGRVERHDLSTRPPGDLVVADFSGNGRPDVAVVDGERSPEGTHVHVFRNQSGRLVRAQTIHIPWPEAAALVAGDIDGDGDVDLAVLGINRQHNNYKYEVFGSEIVILQNQRIGFSIGERIRLPYENRTTKNPLGLAIGDLDGDSDLDFALFVVGDFNTRMLEMRVVENTNRGQSFAVHSPVVFGPQSSHTSESWLVPADLNGNGAIDLVALDSPVQAQAFWILTNEGGLEFEPSPVSTGWISRSSPIAADLTDNGMFDLIIPGRGGLEFHRNVTPREGPFLDHTPLVRGRRATFTVTEAQPGETVHFLYSLTGAGNSVGIRQLGGITLDLLDPINIGPSARADANGVAQVEVDIPPNAPLRTVIIQAVIHRGPGGRDSVKTPFRTARIEAN